MQKEEYLMTERELKKEANWVVNEIVKDNRGKCPHKMCKDCPTKYTMSTFCKNIMKEVFYEESLDEEKNKVFKGIFRNS